MLAVRNIKPSTMLLIYLEEFLFFHWNDLDDTGSLKYFSEKFDLLLFPLTNFPRDQAFISFH